MKKRILNKLKSQGGETIAELLIALLISALALTMLAGLITASSRLVMSGTAKMAEYLNAENAIVAQPASMDSADNLRTMTFSPSNKDGVVNANGSWTAKAVNVYVYVDNKIAKKPVVSYKVKVS